MTENVDQVELLQHGAINMLNFALFNGGTFGLQPYVLQKIFVARSDDVLRKSNMVMYAANFFATVPMLFVGVVYAAKLPAGQSAFPAARCSVLTRILHRRGCWIPRLLGLDSTLFLLA